MTGPVIEPATLCSIITSLATESNTHLRGGMRNLLDLPWVCELARSTPVREAASSVLGLDCFAVRGLFFDKSVDANWRVPWHQDLTVAVREKHEVEGFGPWSIKANVHHVQAPEILLTHMLAVRIHLDDCGPNNGPLRLIPNSHSIGILSPASIEKCVTDREPEVGVAEAGSILGFRPLLLHASSSASEPCHRRVIHLEFAAFTLPGGLEWRWRV